MKRAAALAFPLLLLTFVSMQAHELTHHLAGRVVCGEWGTMTFHIFRLPPACQQGLDWLWSTAAGPALTYLLMLAGAVLVASKRAPVGGALLVFAQLPLARFVTVMSGHGDENVVARQLGGGWRYAISYGICIAIVVPVVIVASRLFTNRLWTIAALLVPMAFDYAIKAPLLEPMLERMTFAPVAGIPPAILVANAVALILALAVLPSASARAGATDATAATRPS